MAGISVSYDIAVEPNKENSPPPPVSDVETLVLSHFSHPPRLDFGSVKVSLIVIAYFKDIVHSNNLLQTENQEQII